MKSTRLPSRLQRHPEQRLSGLDLQGLAVIVVPDAAVLPFNASLLRTLSPLSIIGHC